MVRSVGRDVCLLAVAGMLVGAVPAAGQSLAEVARKEAERRGKTTTPGKVYTNGDLTPDFTKPATPEPAPGSAAKAEEKAPEPTTAEREAARQADEDAKFGVTPRDKQEPGPLDDKNEAYWRERAGLIRSRMAYMNQQVDQLRQRLAGGAITDADERDIVQRTFAKAEIDLKHINDEWLRFETQARDRQIPDHWIR